MQLINYGMEELLLRAMIAICAEMPKISDQAMCYSHLLSCKDDYRVDERVNCYRTWGQMVQDPKYGVQNGKNFYLQGQHLCSSLGICRSVEKVPLGADVRENKSSDPEAYFPE